MSRIFAWICAILLFILGQSLPYAPSLPLLSRILGSVMGALLPLSVLLLPPFRTSAALSILPKHKKQWHLLFLFPLFLLFVCVLSFLGAKLGSLWGYTPPAHDDGPILQLIFLHALLPALSEEICFRYVGYRLLSPFGKTKWIWLSAIGFALVHGSFAVMPYALGAGLVLCMLTETTHSPTLAILFHFFNNTASLVLTHYGDDATLPFWLSAGGLAIFSMIWMAFSKEKVIFLEFWHTFFPKKENQKTQP
ncbi:MAG: CPBP family intramembrane metalloprotease [Clostridia bacterium]|nr:CPBP family intramembrane metalloprotease [Clostridia bacterium]